MSAAYKAGVAVGIFVGIIVFVILFKIVNKDKSYKTRYDEKQEAVRGRGYKYGFFTMLFYSFILIFLAAFDIAIPMTQEVVQFTGIVLGGLVMASYDIWNDAYMGLNTSAKGFAVFSVVVSIINFLSAFSAIFEGRMYKDGILQLSFANLLCGILFIFIGAELLLKSLKDKKEEEED
ncbi:MAG: hypothetical protein J5842_05200 [Lachnospiraceae bacterium]|nr:hypothetical protein [Lachnospiraceae bacterium]